MDENTGYAPYFREVLRSEVARVLKGLDNPDGDEYSVYRDGLKIYTTILQSSEVFAADGTLMGKYYTERGNRSNVSYRDISPHVINALIATEDERFYDHAGIDAKSTMRAVFLLGKEGGGSTITQQLAKTLLDQGSKNKAWRVIEKFKEYIVAIRLERNFTKEEILALYLNAVPFGDNVYGIRNAARTFFDLVIH